MAHPALTRRQLLSLVGAAPLAVAAGDFWNVKPPAEWTTGDVYQLMNHSPWASPLAWWSPYLLFPGPKGVVTWESAQPIRDGLKAELPWVFDGCYVIGVDGAPASGLPAGYLRQSTVLRSTGKTKWTLGAALAQEMIRSSSVYLFGFSRTAAPIGPESGDIVFEMYLGAWRIEATFKPRKMLCRGQLAV